MQYLFHYSARNDGEEGHFIYINAFDTIQQTVEYLMCEHYCRMEFLDGDCEKLCEFYLQGGVLWEDEWIRKGNGDYYAVLEDISSIAHTQLRNKSVDIDDVLGERECKW